MKRLTDTHGTTAGLGTQGCQCAACGRVFVGMTAFDRHQSWTKNGHLTCLEPGDIGLARLPLYGRPEVYAVPNNPDGSYTPRLAPGGRS